MAAPMWSPTVFEGGISLEHQVDISCLAYDLDNIPEGALDTLDAAQETEGFGFIIHSGHSHCAGVLSLRLVLFLSRALTPDEHVPVWTAVARRYSIPVDPAAPPRARRYFVPTVQPGATPILEFQEGRPLDVDTLLASIPREVLAEVLPPAPKRVRPPVESSFDLEIVRRALKHWGSGDAHKDQRARAAYEGKPWAPEGRRDTELAGLVGQIVGKFPRIPLEALELLLTQSAVSTVARDGDESVAYWMERIGIMLERFRPEAEEFGERVEARKEAARKLAERMALLGQRKRMAGRQASGDPDALEDIPRPPETSLVEIQIDQNLGRMVEEAERALGRDGRVFCAPGRLVRLARGGGRKLPGVRDADDAPLIHAIGPATLTVWLARHARWINGKGKQANAPGVIVPALMEHLDWPHVPRLEGFAETPVFRKDGSLLSETGYDEETGLYCVSALGASEVPEVPSAQDIERARETLLEVVADFPFEKPENRAVWVAALLTPFARHALEPPGLAPLFLVDANIAGAGKTKLVDVTAIICLGRAMAKLQNSDDDDEMRKALLAIALSGKPVVTIDNIHGALGCPSLDAALTAGSIEGRMLGFTKMVSAPLRCTWFATGNNLALLNDLERRTLPIRLSSALERPESREGFRHPALERWAQEHRAQLVGAALTVLRGWFQAGKPRHSAKPFGSFEAWQDVVCACVAWLGLPWPEEARRPEVYAPTSQELSHEALDYFEMVAGDEFLTVSEFLSKITNKSHPGKNALQEMCGNGGTISAKSVGKLFSRFRDQNIGGKFMRWKTRTGVTAWARLPGKERES
jgi:hypothetical protein